MKEKPLTEFINVNGEKERQKELRKEQKDVKGLWELPEGWKWVRLEKIAGIRRNSGVKKKLVQFSNIAFIPMELIPERDVLARYEIRSSEEIKSFSYCEPGDILLAKITPCFENGKQGIVPEDIPNNFALATTEVYPIYIKSEEVLDKMYLFYLLKCAYTRKTLEEQMLGTTGRQRVPKEAILNLKIPLPPLEEQKRIVKKLNEIRSRVEEAKRLAREAREKAEQLMASALHEVFSKAEERGWEWKRLNELVSLESGARPKGGVRDVRDGVPSLGGEHLNWDGSFNFRNLKFVPVEFYNSMKRGKIKVFDILIVKDGATTGKVAFVDETFPFKKACINEHLFILRKKEKPAEEFIEKFLFYCLMSPESQEQIKFIFSGSAQGGINQRFAKLLKIPLPPLEEQKRIVAYLDAVSERARQLIKLYEEREKELEKLWFSALDKAFKGKL